MPTVAGLKADDHVAALAAHAHDCGWRVEATKNNRLKFLGPNGEGPVYCQVRPNSRDVQNMTRQLVGAGLPDPQQRRAKEEPTGAVLTVVKSEEPEEDPDDLDAIVGEFTSTLSKAADKLVSALEGRLTEIRRLRTEADEWQELAQQQADSTEAANAQRDAAVARAEDAEAKLDAILAPMRAALAGS